MRGRLILVPGLRRGFVSFAPRGRPRLTGASLISPVAKARVLVSGKTAFLKKLFFKTGRFCMAYFGPQMDDAPTKFAILVRPCLRFVRLAYLARL